jgi:hypothetical protein
MAHGTVYGLYRDGFGLRISRGLLWEVVDPALAAAPTRCGCAPRAAPLCPDLCFVAPNAPDPGDEHVIQQQVQFGALLEELGQATPAMLTTALAARDPSIPEPELTPDVLTRLRARLARTSPPETSGNNA